MKRIALFSLIATIATCVLMVVAVMAHTALLRFSKELDSLANFNERIEYYKLYIEVIKAVVVGFGAALLGVLIPTILAEVRHRFERLKDPRVAYSEAKTAVDYLALRLCTLQLKAAAALIQRAHVSKHEAELYPELKHHLKRRGIRKSPAQWGDALYDKLFDVRELLEAHAGDWDNLSPADRLRLVREVLPASPKDRLVAGAVSPESSRYKGNSSHEP